MNVITGYVVDRQSHPGSALCMVRQTCASCGLEFVDCTDTETVRYLDNPVCETCHDNAHGVDHDGLMAMLREGELEMYDESVRQINQFMNGGTATWS